MIDFFDNYDNSSAQASPAQVVPIITELPEQDHDDLPVGEVISDMPILPLRNMVMFPNMTMPISVGREKSLALIRDAQAKEIPIGVICQTNSKVDDPTLNDLYRVGTVAYIIKILELPDNSTNVILQGRSSFMLNELTAEKPYLRGNISITTEQFPDKDDKEFNVLISSIRELTFKMLENIGDGGRDLAFAIKNIEAPFYLINFLSANIPFEAEQKQMLLEEHNIKKRAYTLFSFLSKEAQLVELKAKIQSRTREDISQQQREHFLQQQIRAIQEELGTGDDDLTQLEERASKKKWSETTGAFFTKELKKLERLSPQSPDYSVQYSYLDTMLNLPWNEFTTDNFNINQVEKKLNHDHYGLENVKDRVLEHLAVLKLRGDLKAPIICLYGPPGVGKTSLGRSIAEALNRKYARISLGGLHDEAEIRGHRRTYIGAMPGRVIDAIAKCGSSNPVVVLDEIDKVGQDFKGDPSSALLEVLDPEQNSHFHDNYLDIDFDLSKVLFIATANNLTTISRPLLDRMEVIEINGYVVEEKVEIARRHLIPKQLEENGFQPHEIKFPKATVEAIINHYTRESGVRELEKKIGKALRKIARLKAGGADYPRSIAKKNLKQYLGVPIFTPETYDTGDFTGVVTGLAWTATGGEILFIETSLSHMAKGGQPLTLTGNLGDVMKESAVLALQYIKAHCDSLNIDPEVFDKQSVHLHVPEGAIPKDGPSAGITIVTALVSSLTGRKVRKRLAMTGEITLRGKVLPVGGIKEKILAAKRAGIETVILCSDNRKDIEEIKPEYLSGLKFHYVDTIDDVLKFALI